MNHFYSRQVLLVSKVCISSCHPNVFRVYSQNCSQILRTLSTMNTHTPTPLDVSGIYPPIITPFDQSVDRKIDYAQLEKNFQKWNTCGFKGYVVLGSNGESVSLSNTEKLDLCKTVRKLASPGSLIIGGLGCHSTRETIELCVQAGKDGSVDAGLIITPSFYKGNMTDEALETFYNTVADESPIPILLYSVPANTGIDLSPELVSKLARHPNIIGLKDSGGDITKISRIIYETNKAGNFQVLAGSAGFLFPALMMGAVGGICALANVLGSEVCQLYSMYQRNEWKSCIELQRKLIIPNTLVTRKFGVPGLKKSMDLKGYYGGPVRPPLLSLSESHNETLTKEFTKENYL